MAAGEWLAVGMTQPESAEEFYARVLAATDEEGRLPVAVEEMPGWDIFPFEIDSLRIKPLQPLLDVEPDRAGEDPADCRCTRDDWAARWPGAADSVLWHDDQWRLVDVGGRLPAMLMLQPRTHHDLVDLPADLAARMGVLVVALAAAVESLPSVGRAHVQKIGDGGAHLHLFFMGRPARVGQFRGSPLLDWEENLPSVPADVLAANARAVVRHLVAAVGGAAVGVAAG